MRLLDTRTYQLSWGSFTSHNVAVLSHMWGVGDDELSMEDLTSEEYLRSGICEKPGFKKLRGFCDVARAHGLGYCWMDSCCTNRDRSEQNEVNLSSFQWFRESKLCVVYLADVDTLQDMPHSRYFTRSYTLVELVAPKSVLFVNHGWKPLGYKEGEHGLASVISECTLIPEDILRYERDPNCATIGEKLSWAPYRHASKEEERIYALISLLNVRMDTRYGEGLNMATRWMKEQILGDLEDYTILITPQPLGLGTSSVHDGIQKREDDQKQGMEFPEWKGLQLHSPVDIISPSYSYLHLPPFEKPPDSPQLTVRGLRVTLFTKQVRDFLIAWTYCTQRRNRWLFAVCIRVDPVKPASDVGDLHDLRLPTADLRSVETLHWPYSLKDRTATSGGSTIQRQIRGTTSGKVCYVCIDQRRLRTFELRDIYFPLQDNIWHDE
ncbi:hypothetical protein K491DRAFT_688032 [Lophiostoma macrostomum CBS 122681]|uniref:Heterokaryon incompatibility domain-containing protein n=1 Tax=Lophiostoma macrostomum CBS 122681 TaxID=1314788 RepID=A0A6A6TLH2_9PLEO|nr:hypothetical protein K491DRAFT_688032 [Lophiostoma macrostomum CBS 122681]